jgi:hypothetical protein
MTQNDGVAMTHIPRFLLRSIVVAFAGASLSAQNPPARASIAEKLDTPQTMA